jgi:hypothetical protein
MGNYLTHDSQNIGPNFSWSAAFIYAIFGLKFRIAAVAIGIDSTFYT